MIFNLLSKSLGKAARWATAGVAALALVSCGGGGGSPGKTLGGSGGGATASSLSLQFSSNQLNSTSATPVTITVTALNGSNAAVPNVAIQFQADSGVITPSANPAVTGTNGQVTATLAVGSNTTPRTIHVTVQGGGQTATGTVQVVGTSGTPSISVLFNNSTLPSAGLTVGAVTVSALVKDSNNNALSGVPVAFTASSGVLTVTSGTSNASGLATATLNTGGNPTNRTITVTATGGGATTTSTIQVAGTTLTPSSSPASLTLGTLQKFTFTLTDSNGNNLGNAPVTFKSAAGNTVVADSSDAGTSSAPVTNSNGVVILDVTPTVGGQDTLTASADGATASTSFSVTSQSLAVGLYDLTTSTPTLVSVNPQPLSEYTNSSCIAVNASYTLNAAGAPGTALVTTSRGALYQDNACKVAYTASSVPFSSSGQMQTLYLGSNTAGTAVVTVSERTNGVAGPSQTASVNFVAQLTSAYTPSITLTASPNLVSPNSPTSPNTNSSSIIATVRDGSPQNNLVQGAQVQFTDISDVSGGTVSPSVVTTQANGQAIATYYPGSGTTAANGVTITAKIQGPITNTIPAQTNLTVSGTSLFVTLGTGNTINVVNDTSYSQDWTVYVTDSNGNPVQSAVVTGQLVASYYTKGVMQYNTTITAAHPTASWLILGSSQPTNGYNLPTLTAGGPWCPNSDINNDGVYDTGDLTILYPSPYPTNPALAGSVWPFVAPGIPGNVAATVGSPTNTNGLPITGANGYASLTVTYPQDHAQWTIVQLTVNAATTGTQSTASTTFTLAGPASAYSNPALVPPGQTSPYGVNNCSTAF